MSFNQGISSVAGPDMNGVLASMAQMTPQQLQQTAAMHSDNALIVSTAKFYSDQQKQYQQAQMAKMQPQAMPPVNQQAIAAMAPTPQLPTAQQVPLPQGQQAQMATNRLPEESGIATLPAPGLKKMAAGGIVAFDDGGQVDQDPTAGGIQGAGGGDAFNFSAQPPTHGIGFARGGEAGSDPVLAYKAYAQTRAQQLGLDPQLVDNMFTQESHYDPEAKSSTGPVGIGQLTKATAKAYGLAPEDRTDPYKNIDASLAYMADLSKKYKGDPAKIAVGYNQGEPYLNAHLKENGGQVNPDALDKEPKNYLAKALTALAPGGNAQAAETQAAKPSQPQSPTAVNAQQNPQRPLTGNEQVIGAGETALQYASSIPDMLASGVGALYKGVTGQGDPQTEFNRSLGSWTYSPRTEGGQRISDATQQVISDLKIPPYLGHMGPARPTPTGLQALKAAAEDAEGKVSNVRLPSKAVPIAGVGSDSTVTMPNDPVAALKADQAAAAQARAVADVAAKNQPAPLSRTGAGIAALAPEARAGAISMANSDVGATQPPSGSTASAAGPTGGGMPPYHDSVYDAPKVDPATAQKAAEVGAESPQAKEAEAKGFQLSNQDLVMMGLGIMGGTSRYALTNIGTGGLQGLAASRQQTAAEAKAAYEKAMGKKADSMGDYYNMRATHPELFLGSYYANDAKKGAQYEQAVQREMAQWDKDNAIPGGMSSQLDPNFQARRMQAELAARQKLAPSFGITNQPDTGTVAAAPQLDLSKWGNLQASKT